MKSNDLINFVGVSTVLTGKRDNIRKDKIPEKYKERVKELTDFVEYWINKHSK